MWTSCQTLWIDKESFEILIGSLEDFERSANRSNSSCCFTLSDTFENPKIDQQKSLSNIPILSNTFQLSSFGNCRFSTFNSFFCRCSQIAGPDETRQGRHCCGEEGHGGSKGWRFEALWKHQIQGAQWGAWRWAQRPGFHGISRGERNWTFRLNTFVWNT